MELKDKIRIDDALIDRDIREYGAGFEPDDASPQKKEAVEALVSLGYGRSEAVKAVNAIEGLENMDSGAVLKAALKKMF